jgi:hypothetical protein
MTETNTNDAQGEPIATKDSLSNGTCFVISPFGGWHDTYYPEIFAPAIRDANLIPTRADSLFRSSNIVHDIWRYVTTARLMLADLTGQNPNVYYELGLAHAARKPVLLLTQDIEDVPFDLRALRVISYTLQQPRWAEGLQQAITQGLPETLESPESAVLPTFLQEDPEQQPRVAADDKRFLDIQQQLNSLRAEVRTVQGESESPGPSAIVRIATSPSDPPG